MEKIYLFQDIVSGCENINKLLSLSEIYDKIKEETFDDNIYDEEIDYMIDYWDESKIRLEDKTEIELINCKTCILHAYDDFEKNYSYKLNDNLYLCAACLTFLVEHDDLCEEHLEHYFDSYLFPKKWNEKDIVSWLRKKQKRDNEYYSRRTYYNDYFYNDDYNDDEDYDFDPNDLSEYDDIFQQNTISTEKEKREKIWEQEDCQALYKEIINSVENPSILTQLQLNQARDISISAIQKNKEPNYEKFKDRVKRDRGLA